MSDKSDSNIEQREETISGYKLTGDWESVVELGERVGAAIRRVLKKREDTEGEQADNYRNLEEFEEWRPKLEDDTEKISEKTAEKASVEEGTGEKAGESVKENVNNAQNGVKETVDSASSLETDEVKDNVTETVSETQKATDSLFRKTLRWIEENVYEHIMTLISPYYFDNELVNANLNDKRGEKYRLEINIADDSIRDDVRDEMTDIDDEAPRWRMEAEIDTEAVEEVEGVESPDTKPMKDRIEENITEEDSSNQEKDSEN